jgi:hypothetical protein
VILGQRLTPPAIQEAMPMQLRYLAFIPISFSEGISHHPTGASAPPPCLLAPPPATFRRATADGRKCFGQPVPDETSNYLSYMAAQQLRLTGSRLDLEVNEGPLLAKVDRHTGPCWKLHFRARGAGFMTAAESRTGSNHTPRPAQRIGNSAAI